MSFRRGMPRRAIHQGACLLALAVPASAAAAPAMLIAPHIAGQSFCTSIVQENKIAGEEPAARACAARGENAASRITALLDSVGPTLSPSGHFALGYTLNLPLMRFYTKSPTGWALDQSFITTAVRTIHDVKRPVVVYLSANHFTDGGIDLSNELAHDPKNLMWTAKGPLPADQYMVVGLHAWTLADPEAPINRMRRAALAATVDAICKLDTVSRARIQAVSVLGEVHQLYGNFLSGEGYTTGFDVTDYSPISIAGFRRFLQENFNTIGALNKALGASFSNFDAVSPPSKDIRHDHLNNFFEHIDAFAAGWVGVQGWAFDPSGTPVQIAIYLDGKQRGQVTANLNRPDVAESDPAITTPNVGWHYDLDYRADAPGVHTLEIFRETPAHRLVSIARELITIVPRDQSPSQPIPPAPVAADPQDPESHVRAYLDGPPRLTPLFYNPLATLWLEYRRQQVASYITGFAQLAAQSCLPKDVIFSHQLLPQLNSSWDSDLMAVDTSQQPNPAYHQGATLYGGAAFGEAFFNWKQARGWSDYGVSEMHPRFALTQAQFTDMLQAHREHGARFVAPYFMTIVPLGIRQSQTGGLGKMTITPDNHQLGSDTFYAAISDVMRNK